MGEAFLAVGSGDEQRMDDALVSLDRLARAL